METKTLIVGDKTKEAEGLPSYFRKLGKRSAKAA